MGTEMSPAEPRVVVCLYELAKWYLERTNRFPKNWRVTLGDRIDSVVLEMLVLGKKAALRKEKVGLLESLSENLEVLRTLTRLTCDVGCLEGRQEEFVSGRLGDIGKQLGGWLKHARGGR